MIFLIDVFQVFREIVKYENGTIFCQIRSALWRILTSLYYEEEQWEVQLLEHILGHLLTDFKQIDGRKFSFFFFSI